MSLSARARLLLGFLFANITIVLVAAFVLLNRPESPPLIQGVLLPDARELEAFQLLDHNNQPFRNENLQGHWTLVSYGFTTCPDICPATLSQLGVVARELEQQGEQPLRVLFYTVDHRRDTVSQLAAYLPFFHPDFIGLTYRDDSNNGHLAFEKSLGIMAQLVPASGPDIDAVPGPGSNEYSVSHGVTLFLINPQGQLQSIFEPDESPPDRHGFDPQRVLRDYLAIRKYLG